MSSSNRSIVYVDGFNLYYSSVRGTRHKWLDLERYFVLLRQGDEIQRIYYFTATVNGLKQQNQASYLRALSTRPLVEIRLGKFKLKDVECRVRACQYAGRRVYKMPEEKQTDVAIGVQMIEDAYEDNCDSYVIVSGDSDLIPAVNAVKRLFPQKKVVVYVPARHQSRGAAVELRAAADKHRTLPQALLARAQFPTRVPDGAGGWIVKPAGW